MGVSVSPSKSLHLLKVSLEARVGRALLPPGACAASERGCSSVGIPRTTSFTFPAAVTRDKRGKRLSQKRQQLSAKATPLLGLSETWRLLPQPRTTWREVKQKNKTPRADEQSLPSL